MITSSAYKSQGRMYTANRPNQHLLGHSTKSSREPFKGTKQRHLLVHDRRNTFRHLLHVRRRLRLGLGRCHRKFIRNLSALRIHDCVIIAYFQYDTRGLSGGAIGGIVGGVVGGLALIGAVAFFLWRRRSNAKASSTPVNQHNDNPYNDNPYMTQGYQAVPTVFAEAPGGQHVVEAPAIQKYAHHNPQAPAYEVEGSAPAEMPANSPTVRT
jgi:MYXO-CTERM domain-containing protein